MRVLRVRNVNEALLRGLDLLSEVGATRRSRAGACVTAPCPVTTVYERPTERVLLWPERDANPFFHLFEALYFLAGRNDAAHLNLFIRDYTRRFSDDGTTLHGSYGHRWRRHWGRDQIADLVALLRANPETRRAVLAMWDPAADLRTEETGRDIPCNTTVMFRARMGRRDEPNRLDMTVTCRSNDIVWGAYGANAVHFSILQEYVAARVGLLPGIYYQVSNDYHAYEDVLAKISRGALARPDRLRSPPDPYAAGEVAPCPLVENPETWDRDLALFHEAPDAVGFDNAFFRQVAKPLWYAHAAYRKRDVKAALEITEQCVATDWRRAAREWLERRA